MTSRNRSRLEAAEAALEAARVAVEVKARSLRREVGRRVSLALHRRTVEEAERWAAKGAEAAIRGQVEDIVAGLLRAAKDEEGFVPKHLPGQHDQQSHGRGGLGEEQGSNENRGMEPEDHARVMIGAYRKLAPDGRYVDAKTLLKETGQTPEEAGIALELLAGPKGAAHGWEVYTELPFAGTGKIPFRGQMIGRVKLLKRPKSKAHDPADPDRRLPVPMVRQADGDSCGPACLESVLRYFGDGATQAELKLEAGTDEDGTPPDAMARVLRGRGLAADVRQGMTVEGLGRELDAGRPVIVDLQAWGDPREYPELRHGHWAVAVGRSDNRVWFMDPALDRDGWAWLAEDELEARWRDREASGEVTDRLGIVVGTAVGEATKHLPGQHDQSSHGQGGMRVELLNRIEAEARKLPRFASLPVEHHKLTTEEQQELISRGLTFTVDRMGKPHVHLSDRARAEELRQRVESRRKPGGEADR